MTYLDGRDRVAASEIRPFPALGVWVREQRFDLLLQQAQDLVDDLVLRGAFLGAHELEHQRVHFAKVRVDEEGHAEPLQGRLRRGCCTRIGRG